MEQTVGRDVVLAVNAEYQYASVFQIDAPLLDEWLWNNGLTLLEAAMIQPAYGAIELIDVESPGHILMVPDGSGPSLAADGHTITIRLTGDGIPIPGFPFQDIWLGQVAAPGLVNPCPGGTVADANTDVNGITTFSNPLAAGGWTDESLIFFLAGVPIPDPAPGITANSPDLDSDRVVNLADVGQFAIDFFNGYSFRADIGGDLDGVLNLLDVATLAIHLGASCP